MSGWGTPTMSGWGTPTMSGWGTPHHDWMGYPPSIVSTCYMAAVCLLHSRRSTFLCNLFLYLIYNCYITKTLPCQMYIKDRINDYTYYYAFIYKFENMHFVTNYYFEFSTSQNELLLVRSQNKSSLISGGHSSYSGVLVCALGLL